ncbi:hypothetical protein [Spiroplasma diminutum]|uniref:ECF transporter S component n=1 Tax=Spiroplasma diminutum CUAS-1 TaxID=1276221 RepID=S5MJ94_9MOLU|nr:hypothetical protein [Spiroplasma diminutum]AGR42035.1 hypothetical protein SDIMI_v3c03310 [Spiroplasma diminutum CUAS-1]
MNKTDEQNQEVTLSENLDDIDLDYEISKLNKVNGRARLKSETLKITLVSLLLSMSTAVSMINIVIPIYVTGINVGFVLKYFVIAISFQVVGIYWGMIIGLFDGVLQFLIWGLSPLFRLTTAMGLVIWVALFWLIYDKLFRVYSKDASFNRSISLIFSGMLVFIFGPLSSASLNFVWSYIEYGQIYGLFQFFHSWISFMVFDLFAIVLFTLTTNRIQVITEKLLNK